VVLLFKYTHRFGSGNRSRYSWAMRALLLEDPTDTCIKRAAVHAKRRLARERLNAVERVHRGVAIGKDVEEIFDTDGQRRVPDAIRRFDIGQPLRAIRLIVRRTQREAAERTVARDIEVHTQLVAAPVAAQ